MEWIQVLRNVSIYNEITIRCNKQIENRAEENRRRKF